MALKWCYKYPNDPWQKKVFLPSLNQCPKLTTDDDTLVSPCSERLDFQTCYFDQEALLHLKLYQYGWLLIPKISPNASFWGSMRKCQDPYDHSLV